MIESKWRLLDKDMEDNHLPGLDLRWCGLKWHLRNNRQYIGRNLVQLYGVNIHRIRCFDRKIRSGSYNYILYMKYKKIR